MVDSSFWSPCGATWKLLLGFAEVAVEGTRGWKERKAGREGRQTFSFYSPPPGPAGRQHTSPGRLTPQGGRDR